MMFPELVGNAQRQILVNYRTQPDFLFPHLPTGFAPLTHEGWGFAGIKLVSLKELRPKGWPRLLGMSVDFVSFRILAKWRTPENIVRSGSVELWRECSSKVALKTSQKYFDGRLIHSTMFFRDDAGLYRIVGSSEDAEYEFEGRRADRLPRDSAFIRAADARDFFARESNTVLKSESNDSLLQIEEHVEDRELQPLAVHHCSNSWFDEENRFPLQFMRFDHALVCGPASYSLRSLTSTAEKNESDTELAPV